MNQASQRLTWIFGIALVVALMAIAFLLGRDSKPGAQVVEVPSTATPSKESAAEVAAYFAKIDAIQAGPTGMSADAFAQQIVAEAAQGKADGFDQLQNDLVRMEDELTAIAPPPACREFHALTVSAAKDARLLMNDLRGAFAGGNPANANQLVARAQAAQDKTKRIEELRKQLELDNGLAH